MNTQTVSLVALSAATLLGVGASARAQDAAAPASVIAEAQPRPDRIVYAGQLPSVAQLTQTAQAQGLTISNITQTAAEIAVTYRLPDNSTRTVSYQLLPTSDTSTVAVAAAPVTTVVAPAPVQVVEVTEPAPTVIYRYRYADPFYYDPFYWGPRAPVSVHLGFGFGGHYRYGGHYYGGHHHYRRW